MPFKEIITFILNQTKHTSINELLRRNGEIFNVKADDTYYGVYTSW